MQRPQVARTRWLALTAVLILPACSGCEGLRHTLVSMVGLRYETPAAPSGLVAEFDGADADRPAIAVTMATVAEGLAQPTDIGFPPGVPGLMWVLEKEGAVQLVDRATREIRTLARIPVAAVVEQGLLGLAFHPRHADNGLVYLNYTTAEAGRELSRVAAWQVDAVTAPTRLQFVRTITEVVQPYQNHNAGVLLFDRAGMLIVPWGDGGWMGDPHGNGQNPQTSLGTITRLDVDRPDTGRGYAIPADNPFADGKGGLPEVWAWGFRNPWRVSLAPDGRLIVADVGQGAWEEVALVGRGENHGWKIREGRACYEPKRDCRSEGLVDPIYVYGREEGVSITGGHVATGERVPALSGKYVFGDFVSGRIWALDLPAQPATEATVYTLGHWPILASTFGRDEAGDLYVADFGRGAVHRIEELPPR